MSLERRDLLAAGAALAALAGTGAGHAQSPSGPAGSPGQRPGAGADGLIRRAVPSSGETLPAIGVGTARRYENVASPAELPPLRATLQALHDQGGTVIDTAPVYGTAEDVVGTLLADLGIRPAMFLATKVSISGQEAGVRQIEDSFRRLRTDRIDLIAVHNLRDTEAHLRTLRDLKAKGRIRYIGVTTSFENQHEALAETMRRERLDFAQVDFALDNRAAAERVLPIARERGIAVMINLPFGRGRLFQAVQGKPLPPWAAEFDCRSWAQFFLKYILSYEAVTCAVPGMAKPDYVADNLGAARGRLPDAAMRRRMEQFIEGV